MQERSAEVVRLRNPTSGQALAPYYRFARFLQDKHTATPSAAQDFPNWVLDRLSLDGVGTALDAGCGWGRFSVQLLRRLPPGSQLVCTDLYDGMVARARSVLAAEGLAASYVVSDLAGLPFDDDRFDLVLANHVLYHVADVPHAVRELARVLAQAGGRLVATTNSDAVPVPLLEIHLAVLDELRVPSPPEEPSSFNLENGRDILADVFTDVDVHIYRDTIYYDDAEALLKVYLNTGRYRMIMADAEVPHDVRRRIAPTFAAHAQEMLAENGSIASPQLMCAYVCRGRST